MKELKLIIEYDEEMEELTIMDEHFNSCSYLIKNINEIGKCVNDFIKEYCRGE